MAIITFSVDDAFMKELRQKLGSQNLSDQQIASEAMALFNWAAAKKAEGKQIAAVDVRTEKFDEVTSSLLSKIPRVG